MLHILIHIYSDNPLFKPFCSLIYILCFTDLARKKISVFWCTFLKCKTRKRLNWIFFFFKEKRKKEEKQTRYQNIAFLCFCFFLRFQICLYSVFTNVFCKPLIFFFSMLHISNLYSPVTSYVLTIYSCEHESQCV